MLYYYVIESVISSSNFIDSRTYASRIFSPPLCNQNYYLVQGWNLIYGYHVALFQFCEDIM